MTSQDARPSEWAAAQKDLIEQMDLWTAEARERQARTPWIGITDEFTFMLSWVPHYFLTGDERLRDFMFHMRDQWRRWADANFFHGYFLAHAEEHHHTENYVRFLARLWTMEPHDERNTRPIEHFVHHLGNWIQGVVP